MRIGQMNSQDSLSSALSMNTVSDVACGVGAVVTAFATSEGFQLQTWESILVAVISALVYAVLNIGTKILTSFLKKKGLIDSETKKKVDDKMEDLADDGKINDSNKEDDQK